jgi:enoyl-CoA hydratase
MTHPFKNILFSKRDGIGTVTINRLDKLNTLSRETLHELREAVQAILEADDIRVGIVTGAGEKSFSAGADVSELAQLDASGAKAFAEFGQRIFSMIEDGGKPFIGAVNGYAFGGGCELALACAIRIASENAKLAQSEIKLGIITGFGASQRLTRIVGKARALELCLLGDPIDAATAREWGLVARVVPPARLLEEANAIASRLAAYSPLAMKYTLETINRAAEAPLNEGLAHEANLFGLCFATEDMKEGTSAFFQKRKPNFRGK